MRVVPSVPPPNYHLYLRRWSQKKVTKARSFASFSNFGKHSGFEKQHLLHSKTDFLLPLPVSQVKNDFSIVWEQNSGFFFSEKEMLGKFEPPSERVENTKSHYKRAMGATPFFCLNLYEFLIISWWMCVFNGIFIKIHVVFIVAVTISRSVPWTGKICTSCLILYLSQLFFFFFFSLWQINLIYHDIKLV